ncbi:aminoglycoside phosphotransferase family protein [Leucothrix arctica]|uniref:aminoglycoside phosphotransferase family protein n=1 Tax=Leucothrix arctica TaxID=1481894 RepID=UPI000D6EA5ED|nr:aminoglycoside phosphotransferase family protein [Leucothrix arctica]
MKTKLQKVSPYLLERLSRLQLLDPQQTVLFTRLCGGMTNQVYLLTQGEVRVTVKMYDTSTQATNPLYPNLPAIEVRALDYLSQSELAPQLLDSWEKQTVNRCETSATLVYEYLAGSVWQSDTIAVAQLLSRLHNSTVTPPPDWLRPLPLSAYEACLHGDAILLQVNAPEISRLKQLRPNSPSREQVVEKSFVHGDCWGGNFIQSEMGLRLIDWQCPGVGDAVEDITNFLSPGMMSFCRDEPLSDDERQDFFKSYDNAAVIERYKRDTASWHWRLACYYLYRQAHLNDVNPELSDGYGEALAKEVAYLQALH